jgi:hypothetical protein
MVVQMIGYPYLIVLTDLSFLQWTANVTTTLPLLGIRGSPLLFFGAHGVAVVNSAAEHRKSPALKSIGR